jgi:hypothetical protein
MAVIEAAGRLLILKRASASRSSGEWSDDYDVLADGKVVGRIFKVHTAPVGTPWMWTAIFAKLRAQKFFALLPLG